MAWPRAPRDHGDDLGILAYVSGNVIFSHYLDIMYIPGSGELAVFIGALLGACIGFLWYNAYPAQVFMGDTGSLGAGRHHRHAGHSGPQGAFDPVLCGVFLVENLSVMVCRSPISNTPGNATVKGDGSSKMSPLHHHYQKKGIHESKIVSRFWIVGIMLAVVSIVTLKLR
jgi:phospho-N-acetylmuramoyl-pentapeptide-transferase